MSHPHRLGNAKIRACVTSVQGGLEALLAMGFVVEKAADGEVFLVLPATLKLSFPDHVVPIVDAKDFHKKENEKVRVAKGLSRVAPAGETTPDPRSAAEIAQAADTNVTWLQGLVATA